MTRRHLASASRSRMTRRSAIQSGAAAVPVVALASTSRRPAGAAGATPAAPGTPAATDLPVSGQDVPELAGLDTAVRELVSTWGLPGAQLAVGYEGRLVLDRGYGYADRDALEPVDQDHRFRIASVSKTITIVAIMRLVQDGSLSLDDAIFPLLDLDGPTGAFVDPILATVTVGPALIHAGGWNAPVSGDPQYLPLSQLAAATFGELGPAPAETIVRFMIGTGLDYEPRTMAVYSNFGFNVLGRVLEKVSGQPYESHVQEWVLAPAGISDMVLGGTRLSERAEGEVRYYAPPEYPPAVPPVFPGEGFGPFAYGSFFMGGMDAHGGWIARASDLVRYASAIDGLVASPLLGPETVERMLTAPTSPSPEPTGPATPTPLRAWAGSFRTVRSAGSGPTPAPSAARRPRSCSATTPA